MFAFFIYSHEAIIRGIHTYICSCTCIKREKVFFSLDACMCAVSKPTSADRPSDGPLAHVCFLQACQKRKKSEEESWLGRLVFGFMLAFNQANSSFVLSRFFFSNYLAVLSCQYSIHAFPLPGSLVFVLSLSVHGSGVTQKRKNEREKKKKRPHSTHGNSRLYAHV